MPCKQKIFHSVQFIIILSAIFTSTTSNISIINLQKDVFLLTNNVIFIELNFNKSIGNIRNTNLIARLMREDKLLNYAEQGTRQP